MSANVETMAYVGEVPWHGLGTKIKQGATIIEVGEKAEILWEVDTRPLYFNSPNGEVAIPDRRVLFRTSDDMVFDVVGPNYEPIQNRELLSFFEEYLVEGNMWIETCGSLQNGRIIWALAKMDKSFTVGRGDESEGYVLLVNYHQYGKAGLAKFTAIRVVCNNTLTLALARGSDAFALRMRHDVAFDADRRAAIKTQMGIAFEQFDMLKEVGKSLTKLTISDEDAVRIAAEIMGGSDRVKDFDFGSLKLKDSETLETLRTPTRRVLELFAGEGMGSHLKTAKGTGWGMLNAVTQYTDFEYGTSDQDARLARSWLGRGDVLKRKALVTLSGAAGTATKFVAAQMSS